MRFVRELRWVSASLAIMTVGAAVLTVSADAGPDSARAAFLLAYLGFASAVLYLGRERTRRPHR